MCTNYFLSLLGELRRSFSDAFQATHLLDWLLELYSSIVDALTVTQKKEIELIKKICLKI